jgi:heme oxygenase
LATLIPSRVLDVSVPTEPSTNTARGTLRHATRDIHERLHALGAFRPLLAQTITHREYCALLEALYGFHQPLEAALVAHPGSQALLPMTGRRRAHLLAEDLGALRGSHDPMDLPRAPPPLDVLARPGGYLGCLYVREGAILGGRVLAGKLDHLLGRRTEGRRFFSGSAHDAELWRSCCATIDQAGNGAALDGMIAAARATFEHFERWMTRSATNHGVTV